MAESFVKTLKRNYLSFIDLESAETALSSLPSVMKLNNEKSVLDYLPLVEFREKIGLIETKTKPDGPICLISGFMLNNSGERLVNREAIPKSQRLSCLLGSNPTTSVLWVILRGLILECKGD